MSVLDGIEDFDAGTTTGEPVSDVTVTPSPAYSNDPVTALPDNPTPSPSIEPAASVLAPDATAAQETPASDAAPLASEAQSPNMIELSTHRQDVTGWSPQQIAALVQQDGILKSIQSQKDIMRAELQKRNAAPAAPAQTEPPKAPTGPTDADIKAAWAAYIEDSSFENHSKYQALREAQIEAKYDAKLQQALRAQTQALFNNGLLVTQDLQEVAQQSQQSRQNAVYENECAQYLDGLIDLGLDVKSVSKSEMASAYSSMLAEAREYVGPNGEKVDLNDPNVITEIKREALKEVRATKKVSTPTPAAAPVPNGVPQPRAQANPHATLVPLPKAAPGPAQVPSRGSQQGNDPWSVQFPEGTPMSQQLAHI